MSTIASPRPSITLSSRRTSTSTDTTTLVTAADRGSLRRNRAALRDYYGIQAAASADGAPKASDGESELDKPDFNAHDYVMNLLSKEGLEGVLKVEAGLVSEIRNLDGEKKALVYDNYAKLIAATDTIKSMREKMDPMTPTTSTLTPAIGHIAETASALSKEMRQAYGISGNLREQEREKQKQTVRWVLGAPTRLRQMVEDGRKEDADKEWEDVQGLLGKWSGVRGVEETRIACLQALERNYEK